VRLGIFMVCGKKVTSFRTTALNYKGQKWKNFKCAHGNDYPVVLIDNIQKLSAGLTNEYGPWDGSIFEINDEKGCPVVASLIANNIKPFCQKMSFVYPQSGQKQLRAMGASPWKGRAEKKQETIRLFKKRWNIDNSKNISPDEADAWLNFCITYPHINNASDLEYQDIETIGYD